MSYLVPLINKLNRKELSLDPVTAQRATGYEYQRKEIKNNLDKTTTESLLKEGVRFALNQDSEITVGRMQFIFDLLIEEFKDG